MLSVGRAKSRTSGIISPTPITALSVLCMRLCRVVEYQYLAQTLQWLFSLPRADALQSVGIKDPMLVAKVTAVGSAGLVGLLAARRSEC